MDRVQCTDKAHCLRCGCLAVAAAIFLYTKFFDWWWEWLPKWLFFLLIALSAVLLLLVFQRLRRLGITTPGSETGGSA